MSKISHLLNISVVIQRKTQSVDDYGNYKDTYTTSSTVNSRRSALNGTQILANQKLGFETTDKFFFDESVDILTSDRVYYGSEYYQVMFNDNPQDLDYFKVAVCNRLKGETNG